MSGLLSLIPNKITGPAISFSGYIRRGLGCCKRPNPHDRSRNGEKAL